MSHHTLVFSLDEGVPPGLQGRALIVATQKPEAISRLREALPSGNPLSAILLKSLVPLDSIGFQEDWGHTPILVHAPGLGSFRKFARALDIVRRLQIELFLPASNRNSYRELPILSSLGLRCGLVFDEGEIPWDHVNDLMHFGIYTKLSHGPIQPFHYVAAHYRPEQTLDFGDVYFNNPAKYLHLSAGGKIALSEAERERGIFIADGLDHLADIAENKEYRHRMRAWQDFFLPPSECASCEGWRICLGKFAATLKNGPACKAFFIDLLEAAEFHRKRLSEGQGSPWPY